MELRQLKKVVSEYKGWDNTRLASTGTQEERMHLDVMARHLSTTLYRLMHISFMYALAEANEIDALLRTIKHAYVTVGDYLESRYKESHETRAATRACFAALFHGESNALLRKYAWADPVREMIMLQLIPSTKKACEGWVADKQQSTAEWRAWESEVCYAYFDSSENAKRPKISRAVEKLSFPSA